jgi:hypothetical protein
MGVNQSTRGIESSLDEEGQWYFYINFGCYNNFVYYSQFWGRHYGQSCKFCSYVLWNLIVLGGYHRFGLIYCFYPEDGGMSSNINFMFVILRFEDFAVTVI